MSVTSTTDSNTTAPTLLLQGTMQCTPIAALVAESAALCSVSSTLPGRWTTGILRSPILVRTGKSFCSTAQASAGQPVRCPPRWPEWRTMGSISWMRCA